MTGWVAVVLVGLGSYGFRVVPLLLVDRITLTARTEAVLRHAAVGAVTALLVSAAAAHEPAAMAGGVGVAGALTLRGRSMAAAAALGGAAYAVVLVTTGIR